MLIFCSSLLNSICLFRSLIKFMLKLSKSLKESVLNEKHKCSPLFICSYYAKGAFTHNDFPFISSERLILSRFITPRIMYTFPFISIISPSLSSVQVIKCFLYCLISMKETGCQWELACNRCFCTFLACLVFRRQLFLSVQNLGHCANRTFAIP